MPQVPEFKGLMVDPAGVRQGRFEYAPTKSDQTAQKYFADAADKAVEFTARQIRAQKKAHDDMVDARATELANQFYQYGTEITVGKDGALRKLGADVVKPKDGQPFTQTYVNLLTSRADELLSSVDDAEVVKKAREKIDTYGRQFQAQIVSHEGAQSYEYVKAQAAANVDVAANNIRIQGASQSTIGALNASLMHQADVGGLDVNDPTIRAAIRADLRTKASKSATESIVGYIDRGDLASAERAYIAAANADALTMEDRHNTRTLIKAAKDDRMVNEASGNATMWIAAQRTPGFVASNIAFGDKLASAENLDAAGVKVPEGAESNPALRAMLNAQVVERFTDRYGTTEAALAAITIGPGRMDEAIEAGGASNWMGQLTPSEKAAVTKATKKYDYDVGLKTAPTDTEIRAAIVSANPDMSPRLVEAALNETKARLALEEVRRDTAQSEAANAVLQAYQNGGSYSDIPYSVRTRLSDSQRAAAKSLFHRDPNQPFYGGSKLYMNLTDNPEALKSMKDADFNLVVRSQTTDEEFAALASRRNYLRGMQAINTTVNRDRVSNAVDTYGRQMYGQAWDKTSDAEMRFKRNKIIDEAVRRSEVMARATVGVGGASKGFTDDVLQVAVESAFQGRLNVKGGFFSSGDNVPWFELDVDDLPSDVKEVGELLAKKKFNVREPTDQMVLSSVVDDVGLDPKNTVDADIMTELRLKHGDELEDIQEVFERNRGVRLDDAALLRVFVLKKMDDQAWYDASGLSKGKPTPSSKPSKPVFGEDGLAIYGNMMD